MSDQSSVTKHRTWEVVLTEDERAALSQAVDGLRSYHLITDTERFVLEAQLLAGALPPTLLRPMFRFRRSGHPSGGLLVRRLPIGEVPATPKHADLAVGAMTDGAHVLSLIAAEFGDQFGFRPELGGNAVQDILPVRGFEETQQSISSKMRLFDHVEMAFTRNRADYVLLLCLRQDHDGVAGTTLSSVDAILPQLDPATIAILREPRFKTTVDGSFLRGTGRNDPIWIGPISVMSGSHEIPRLRADFAETKGLDDEAQEALDVLCDVAAQVAVSIALTPGDLLVIDNHRAFHGRTSFAPRWDGYDRWLLRTFVTKDLSLSLVDRPGDTRIVDADYSAGPDVLRQAA